MYAAELAGVILATKADGYWKRLRARMIPHIFDESGNTSLPSEIGVADERLKELEPAVAVKMQGPLGGVMWILYR